MASTTYTKIEKPSSEQDANKIVTLNVGTDDIDVMVGGFLSISVAGSSNVTLTRAQALNAVLKFTGALTGNIIIYIPVIANAAITPPTTTIGAIREYTVWNATTGAFSLTVKTSAVASAGVAVTQGTKSLLAHDGTDVFAVVSGGGSEPASIGVAVSDETTAITTGTAKVTFRMPHAMTVSAVRASVNTVSSSGVVTVDINEGGTTILSTKLNIDASEKTSLTAATPPVISDSALADDAEITIDIDAAGTGAKGLKVWLSGTRA